MMDHSPTIAAIAVMERRILLAFALNRLRTMTCAEAITAAAVARWTKHRHSRRPLRACVPRERSQCSSSQWPAGKCRRCASQISGLCRSKPPRRSAAV